MYFQFTKLLAELGCIQHLALVEKKTLFVDVILPLAIPNLLTYRVPVELNEHVVIGQRVIVQLGKSKLYTAIIRTIHEVAPSNYIAKYLEALLDEGAIVNEIQLRLWEWMSKYYMCNIGEVMSACYSEESSSIE